MRYILTGAPGSGKTAILALFRDEIHCVDEPAREILAEQRAWGGRGTPDQDPARFLELLLQRSIRKYAEAEGSNGPVLYDRGVPDCIGYAVRLGGDPAPCILAAESYRYHPQVLVLEPWKKIYTTDDERKMSFADSVEFHDQLTEGYRLAGYELIVVPRGSIEEREWFVRRFMRQKV